MALNTLHLCTSDSWGGLEIYSCTIMAELKKAGCQVYAICKPNSRIEEFLKQNQIQCFYMPSHKKVSLASIRLIKSIVREHRIDVLHVHFGKDIWPASLALIGDNKQKLFFSNYMGATKKKDILHRIIYSRFNAIFTSSSRLADQLKDMYPVPASKIHLLPYGRHIESYRRDEATRGQIRATFGVKDDEVLAGTMVRIDPQKGPLDFVKSFVHINASLRSKIKFIVVGEPTRRGNAKPGESPFEPICEAYFEQIKDFIAKNELHDKVILAGFQNDVIGYLGAMDIFVFPSHNELYSLAVLDAMCMKLPVVATRAGGNLEQVTENLNGLFYKVGDSMDLAEKLSLYLSQPELRKQHGEKARQFVQEKHDMDVMIKKLMEFYIK